MQDTITVGELKKIIEDGGYSDDTPIVLESFITNGEAIALQLYPVETTLDNAVIMLEANPEERMGFENL